MKHETQTTRAATSIRSLRASLIAAATCFAFALPAFAVPTYTPIDSANTSDRQVLVYFEVSPWDAGQNEAPSELDGVWTVGYVATLAWASGTVTVTGADFTSVVDQSDPTNSVFSNIAMNDYTFQINTTTGALSSGGFSGTAQHNGAAVAWNGSVSSGTVYGHRDMTNTANAVDGTFDYWRSCTMGMNCSLVGGVGGTIDWTYTAGGGPTTVSVFNPFGNLVVGEVPEPSTALLVGLGLVGLGIAGRNRSR